MKKINLILLLFSVCAMLVAQNLQELTLEDVISGGKNFRTFIPTYKNYSFKGGSDVLTLNERDSIYTVLDNNEQRLLVTLDDVNNALESCSVKKMKSLSACKWINENEFWVKTYNTIIVYNVVSKSITYKINIPEKSTYLSYSSNAKAVAYIFNNDLYLKKSEQEAVLIEAAGNENVVLGQSVHRSEFGITNGIFWSPKGSAVAFYRMDESMVTNYPLVNVNERVAEVENIKYPMAGMTSHEVTVGVYDIEKATTKYMNTGAPKEKYLTNISWSPDEALIFIAELNRGQDHMSFKAYNAKNGEGIKTIFEEESDKWVEPEHVAEFVPGNNSQFIWQSERDGFNHIYLYDIEKGFIKQLTKGNWVVTSVLGFDKNGDFLFVESTKDGAMNRHLYKVSLRTGEIDKLSSEDGFHSFVVSASGKSAIDMYSSLHVPRKINLLHINTKKSEKLFSAINPFRDYNVGEVKLGQLKSADGKTDLNYRLMLPSNFDPTKKYPVVVYVYGGPHAQMVRNSWLGSARLWQVYMAQQGYVCFTMDNRGAPARGCEFEQVIHRQLGENEAQDQYEGVKFLKSLPYVDENRIGVHGWSFGGFMTINLMEKFPDIFKVGVSGGPVTDWKYYEIMYGERYMDKPEENTDGYKKSNLNLRVENIEGRLLVIHGAIDPTVVWQHSLAFTEQCIKKRKQIDYFVYPRHEHNVLGPDRVHLMEKVTQYFRDFL